MHRGGRHAKASRFLQHVKDYIGSYNSQPESWESQSTSLPTVMLNFDISSNMRASGLADHALNVRKEQDQKIESFLFAVQK